MTSYEMADLQVDNSIIKIQHSQKKELDEDVNLINVDKVVTKRRKNGFQCPTNYKQIIMWVEYFGTLALFVYQVVFEIDNANMFIISIPIFTFSTASILISSFLG